MAGTRLAVFGLLLAAQQLGAQARLTGTVRDSSGAPLPGVEVSVQGVTRTATTDRAGSFRFDGLNAGTTTIFARRLGYASQTSMLTLVVGDNKLPDITMIAAARQLDTVTTRENQLWRERPLLREMAENQKIGLGQFITAAEFRKNQGGFISPMVSQKRGLEVVRGARTATWLANKYLPPPGYCTELEDGPKTGEGITPPGANCKYCFPDVYLDYTKISGRRMAPNIGRFSPDMLEAMEIYLGAAETPIRYASGESSCGVIVLHTRAVEAKSRVIVQSADRRARSRVLANISTSFGQAGAGCVSCGNGSALQGMMGYTLRDRWVIGGHYGSWSGTTNGPQSITTRQAMLEWYPHADPGRVKWFLNGGVGTMSVDVRSNPTREVREELNGTQRMMSLGTGIDFSLVRGLVLTPFFSYARTAGGEVRNNHCVSQYATNGSVSTNCYPVMQPHSIHLTQLGTRIGWR